MAYRDQMSYEISRKEFPHFYEKGFGFAKPFFIKMGKFFQGATPP